MPDILDISTLLSPRLAVWPGDMPFLRNMDSSFLEHAPAHLSSICMTLHAGTHADAPAHLAPEGADVAHLDLAPFLGPCEVVAVHLPPRSRIRPEHLPGPIRAPRVLFRTDSYPDPERFSEDFVGLSPELIRDLKDQGCVLVGIDTPSLDPFESRGLEAHLEVGRCGLRCLENLVLGEAEPGLYTLVALPLKFEDADGSPVRAALVRGGL